MSQQPDLFKGGDMPGSSGDMTGGNDLRTPSADLKGVADLESGGDMVSVLSVQVAPGDQLEYVPPQIVIHVGQTVTWTWVGKNKYSLISGNLGEANGIFCAPSDTDCDTAPDLPQGTVYKHTFMNTGLFGYYDLDYIDANMAGTVQVLP